MDHSFQPDLTAGPTRRVAGSMNRTLSLGVPLSPTPGAFTPTRVPSAEVPIPAGIGVPDA
jgi:hypothetical protein